MPRAKPKTVQDWRLEIKNALAYRKMFAKEAAWRKCEQNYLNDPVGDTAIGPNLVYEMADTLTSTLTVPDPEFVVEATNRSGLQKAPIIESMDNAFVRKLRLKKYIDVGVLRGFLYGNIILKIGYDSEFGWNPYYDIGPDNNLLGMTLTQFDKRGRRIESPDTRPGWPWVRPVLPHDFVVPWGTIFVEDAPWAAQRFVRHVDYFKKDPKYKNTSSLKPEISMESYMMSYLKMGSVVDNVKQRTKLMGIADANKSPEYVVCWEIVDRVNGERIVISEHHSDFLRKTNDAIQMACGMPYVTGSLSLHPRSFWCISPAYYLGQLQAIQFDISKQAEKQRRISILKFLYRKGAIKKEALNKFLSGDVGACEAVEGAWPLNEVIAPLQTGMQFDSSIQSENNRRDARSMSGLSRNQMGEFDKSTRRTAAETKQVALGSGRRTGKRGQVIAGLYTDIIEKVNQLVFNFWRVPREVLHGKGNFAVVTGEMLKGEYDYSVSLSTKRNVSRAERKMEALMMLGQLMPFLQGADISAVLQYLIDASGDPAFEAMFMSKGQGGGGKQGALPAGGST